MSEVEYRLKEACQEYIEFVEGEDFDEDNLIDYESEIIHRAMEYIFDLTIWDRVKKARTENLDKT